MYCNHSPCCRSRHLILMKVTSGEMGPHARHHRTVNGACGWTSAGARHMVFFRHEGPEGTDGTDDSYPYVAHHQTTGLLDVQGQPSGETVDDDSDPSSSFEDEYCEAEHLIIPEEQDSGETECSDDAASCSRNLGITRAVRFNCPPPEMADAGFSSSENEDRWSGPTVHLQEDYSGGEVPEHGEPVCVDQMAGNNREGSAGWTSSTSSNPVAPRLDQCRYSMEYRWSPMLKYCRPDEVIYRPIHLC